MKKNGFTLAEVLITLAIIGVVATLTLPSLLANTQEQQAMTAYKKVLNTLNEAGQISAANNGFDYSTITGAGNITDSFENGGAMTLGAIVHDGMKVTPGQGAVALGNATNCAILLDGSAICLGGMADVAGTTAHVITVDTNGRKGPNQAATCGEAGCTTKTNRHINDQYQVTLYGGQAYPGTWNALETYANTTTDFAALYAAGVVTTNAAGGGGN